MRPASCRNTATLAMAIVCLAIGSGMLEAAPRDANPGIQPQTLPFAFSMVKKGEGAFFHGDYIDYPLSQVVVRGEVWSFHTTAAYANPTPIVRYKGPDFEHLTRQADGKLYSSEPDVSCHIGCGIWFDDSTGTLYPIFRITRL